MADAIKNAVSSASETVQQGISGVSKEGNKEVAKDSNAPAGTRAEAAKDAASDKVSETTHSVRPMPLEYIQVHQSYASVADMLRIQVKK